MSMKETDWSADQYLKFNAERTRPSRDLVSQIPVVSPARIVDLGCGPGNSTEVLAAQFPQAKISGMDSSPDMIAKAKAALPQVEFSLGDLNTYRPSEAVDLFFANAVLQWFPAAKRLDIITGLLESQRSGGVVAFQVPDNLTEPSHEAMREVAAQGPWAEILARHQPTREGFQTPQQLYDHIGPQCSSVDIWHTNYQHVLDSHAAIVEWVKGTGLRPYIDPLPVEMRDVFLAKYLERLKEAYPLSRDGKVLFRFPRLFFVAVRK